MNDMPFVSITILCAVFAISATYLGVDVRLQGFAYRYGITLTLFLVTLQSYGEATANKAYMSEK